MSGGKEAIEESIRLLDYYRSGSDKDVGLEAIESKLSLLVDRVMSEAGLYSTTYAALALKQCEGSVEEAVFLLRAYRSTLTRNYYTDTVSTDDMRIVRRISAAFKDIEGGQVHPTVGELRCGYAELYVTVHDGDGDESGLTDQILEDPQHAYTQQLVHSLI